MSERDINTPLISVAECDYNSNSYNKNNEFDMTLKQNPSLDSKNILEIV